VAGEAPQYNELAPYYDYVYSWKDYREEAATVERLIQKHKKSTGKALLDVGCGTGKHTALAIGSTAWALTRAH